ncbi:MAG: acyltransferase [Myxococcota bacterium]
MFRRIAARVRDEWRLKRDPVAFARSLGVTIGEGCRLLGTTRGTFGSEPWLVTLGRHVTVTDGVKFVTHDGAVWVFREGHPDVDRFGPIVVGDNVFLGIGCVLLPDVRIGSNTVVAAGAVVTKDQPGGAIVGGTPARVLGTIEDYWKRHEHEFLHVRSLPPDEKRRRVLAHLAERKR